MEHEETRYCNRRFLFLVSSYFQSMLVILPTVLLFLILVDVIFMAVSVFCLFILLIVWSIFKLRKASKERSEKYLHLFEDKMNDTLQMLFSMSKMDVQGFRRQKTLLQLQLESIP